MIKSLRWVFGSIFVLEREMKRELISVCMHVYLVIFVALFLAATLLCFWCWGGLYHIIYTSNLISLSTCFVLIPSRHSSHPGALIVRETSRVTAMPIGSNKWDQGARGLLEVVGGFDTTSSLGPLKVWGMGVERGIWSQQFPGQSLSRVNYYTNRSPLAVMVSALVIRASFAHLAFLRLPEFYHVVPLRHSPSPAALLPRCCDLKSVTFCSVADKAVIICDNGGERKKRENMSVISFLLVSCGVNNSNVS